MNKILIVSSDEKTLKNITETALGLDSSLIVFATGDRDEALEILNYDLPSVSILDFSASGSDMYWLIEKINEDPWLRYSGIIALYNEKRESEFAGKVKNSNIICPLHINYLAGRLNNILKIVLDNSHMLFQREFQHHLSFSVAGSFVMDNDPLQVNVFANIITNYLINNNFIDMRRRDNIRIALVEILMNAVEHGNCGITFEEKTAGLLAGRSIFDLIGEKTADPQIAGRKVFFDYKIETGQSSFIIKDEGAGFDWQAAMKRKQDTGVILPHGRGILITSEVASRLSYNQKGNEATLVIEHQKNRTNLVPDLFRDTQEIFFNQGDIVFRRGDKSNYLFYIVNGEFAVFNQSQKIIDVLSPRDIFIGEMSFLLDDHRTATVKARTQGTLIKISKVDFIRAIKKQPYYALFLARLLAGRLNKMNIQYEKYDQKVIT